MKPPPAPVLQPVSRISPSLYVAARRCLARAAWVAHGQSNTLPKHPRAMLGSAVHHVLELAGAGRLAGNTAEERRESARSGFDDKMRELFASAHKVLQAKFSSPERLPYYNLYRERVALLAAEQASDNVTTQAGSTDGGKPRVLRETLLEANSGKLFGRPDLVDASKGEVKDYKTGRAPEDGRLRDDEARQMRLYAHLANENNLPVSRGIVVRADRTEEELPITADEATAEAGEALTKLDELNAAMGKSFYDIATPSAEACELCPCIATCERFWEADFEPPEKGYLHAEGVLIEDIAPKYQGVIGLKLDVSRGTTRRGVVYVERLTEAWLTAGGDSLPKKGDRVRVLHLRVLDDAEGSAVVAANREMTTVWQIP